MNRYFLILSMGISFLFACNAKHPNSVIHAKYAMLTGDLKNYPDGWIFVENVLSGKEDSTYVENGKFSIRLSQDHGSYYYYFKDDANLFLFYIPTGDTLTIEAKLTGDSLAIMNFKGKTAAHNRYLDELLLDFNKRYEKLSKIFTYASLDSLMAFHQMELAQTNSRIQKYLSALERLEDSLFVSLEKKRIEWKQIYDLFEFPTWYYFYTKQPFTNDQYIDEIFKKQNLSDSFTLWLPEAVDAMQSFFKKEYYRLAKQWKEKTPEKKYFLLDYWNYALAEYGYFPAMQVLVPAFLYSDVAFRLDKSSLQLAKHYFRWNPAPNYKNKYLKNIVASIEQLKQGHVAPPFTMVDLSDTSQKYSLNHFLGKELIIEFGSTGCPGCLQAANMVKNQFNKIKNKSNLTYLYVLVEEYSDRIDDFTKKNKFPFPVFRVDDYSLDAILENYVLYMEPRFVWIDKQGKLKEPFLQAPWNEEFWTEIDKI